MKLSDLNCVSNSEKTRWFLVLRCRQSAENQLTALLKWCNGVCKELGLKQLYAAPRKAKSSTLDGRKQVDMQLRQQDDEDRSHRTASRREPDADRFHFSIAWFLEQPSEIGGQSEDGDVEKALKEVFKICVRMDNVKVKMGNVITSLDLGKRREDLKSILG